MLVVDETASKGPNYPAAGTKMRRGKVVLEKTVSGPIFLKSGSPNWVGKSSDFTNPFVCGPAGGKVGCARQHLQMSRLQTIDSAMHKLRYRRCDQRNSRVYSA